MTPENQRDEDIEVARKYAHSIPVCDFGSLESIRVFAKALADQRQSWEREKSALETELRKAEGAIRTHADSINALMKEKAGLQEQCRGWIKFQTEATIENCTLKEEITRLKSRNEELEAEKSNLKDALETAETQHGVETEATDYIFKRCDELRAENYRLKSENERLRDFSKSYDVTENDVYQEAKKEIDRLKAENAEIKKSFLECKCTQEKIDRLSASLAEAKSYIEKLSTPDFLEKYKRMEAVVEAAKAVMSWWDLNPEGTPMVKFREALEALDAKGERE